MSNLKGFALGSALLCLMGCGGGIVGQQQPRVRLFNGADGQAVVFASFQDASLVNLGMSPNAAFGSATADTIITNTTATATISAPSGPLVTTQPTLFRVGSFYTVYAYGAASPGYHGLVLEDSQSIASGGNVGVRAVELGKNAPAVDIFFNLAASQANGGPLFSNLQLGLVSGSANTTQAVDLNGYVLFPTNSSTLYAVTVTAHGSTTPIASTTVTVSPGSYYTIVVFDTGGATTQTSAAILNDHRT
ncbi:MAG TPA: DUF4397 domain-containing protein [Fimbriimonadaceae bacterium]|nr:DUF4397 domain-containing protein [Fimbriimonadaceae bacterium]